MPVTPLTTSRDAARSLLRPPWGWNSSKYVLLLSALLSWPAQSLDGADIVGVWRTIDDETGRPAALVQIVAQQGIYSGRVIRVLDADAPALCIACTGELHNQPILGMTILTGLRRTGDAYEGGKVLDPDSGESYQARAKLVDGGTHLAVRGYIGLSLFGRSQLWQRLTPASPGHSPGKL